MDADEIKPLKNLFLHEKNTKRIVNIEELNI